MKICACCKDQLPKENFSLDGSRKDGLFKYCKPCHAKKYQQNSAVKKEYQKAYRLQNLDKHKNWSRSFHLKNKYGITQDQYESMLVQQGSTCAICKGLFTSKIVPQIDHDHDTGKVRGLLCRPCNTGIGMLKEDLTILQNAKDYLSS